MWRDFLFASVLISRRVCSHRWSDGRDSIAIRQCHIWCAMSVKSLLSKFAVFAHSIPFCFAKVSTKNLLNWTCNQNQFWSESAKNNDQKNWRLFDKSLTICCHSFKQCDVKRTIKIICNIVYMQNVIIVVLNAFFFKEKTKWKHGYIEVDLVCYLDFHYSWLYPSTKFPIKIHAILKKITKQ